MTDDAALLKAYVRTRSDEVFRVLVDRYAAMVYSTCLKLTSSEDQAEDASQSVFLLLAERAPRISVDKPLANWLFATCRNVCRGIARDERRRMKRELPLNESTAKACDPHIPDFSLIEALERLRRDEREAVLLRFFSG